MEQVKAQPVTLRPLNEASVRATNFELRFDGGSFELHVYEQRESPELREGPFVRAWELVEIARFAISPVALTYLDGAVAFAKSSYQAAIGHPLPDPAKVNAELQRLAVASRQAPKR
jgi:hypothetical protein